MPEFRRLAESVAITYEKQDELLTVFEMVCINIKRTFKQVDYIPVKLVVNK